MDFLGIGIGLRLVNVIYQARTHDTKNQNKTHIAVTKQRRDQSENVKSMLEQDRQRFLELHN